MNRCEHGRHPEWCDDCHRVKMAALREQLAQERKRERAALSPADRRMVNRMTGGATVIEILHTEPKGAIVFEDFENERVASTYEDLRRTFKKDAKRLCDAMNEVARVDPSRPDYADIIARAIRYMGGTADDLRDVAQGYFPKG